MVDKLEIKFNSYTPKWDNFLDLRLEFDEDGKPYIRLYIVNFPYLFWNCYARVCSKYILFRLYILVSKLLNHG